MIEALVPYVESTYLAVGIILLGVATIISVLSGLLDIAFYLFGVFAIVLITVGIIDVVAPELLGYLPLLI